MGSAHRPQAPLDKEAIEAVIDAATRGENPPERLKKSARFIDGGILAALGGEYVPDTSERFNDTLKVYAGKLVEKIPRIMRVEKREQIEVRLGTEETPRLAFGLVGSGELVEHDLPVVETMAVDLYSPDDSFKVEAKSDREQLIKKDALRGTPLAKLSDDYGRWMWNVTPQRIGKKQLCIRVSARVLDSHGHPTPHTLVPDKEIEIDVKVNKSALAWRGMLWVGGAILAAVAAYFHDVIRSVVWPILKDIMQNLFGVSL